MGCLCKLMAQNRYILLPPNTLNRRHAMLAYFIQPSLPFFVLQECGEGLVSFFECKELVGEFF